MVFRGMDQECLYPEHLRTICNVALDSHVLLFLGIVPYSQPPNHTCFLVKPEKGFAKDGGFC